MTVRRNAVVPVEQPPQTESRVHRCQSCGVGLHGKARRQYICSWCKGDPMYGEDDYFFDIIEDHIYNVLIPAGKLEHLPDGTKSSDLHTRCVAWIIYLSNRRVWGENAHDEAS